MDLGLTGARALVGGASQGLGAAIAQALAAEGARVGLASRNAGRLDSLAAQIDGVAIPTDLGTSDGPANAVATAAERLGGLDVLVVNSGGPPKGTFAELSEEQWRTAIDGTLFSTTRLLSAALPHLRQGRNPAILVILSSSVREPLDGLVTSNVLRPGLAGLIKSILDDIAPVRINGVAPGRIATERVASNDQMRASRAGVSFEEIRRQTSARIPLGRYGNPTELGRVAAFLCSPAASYVNGQIVSVDGGLLRSLP